MGGGGGGRWARGGRVLEYLRTDDLVAFIPTSGELPATELQKQFPH